MSEFYDLLDEYLADAQSVTDIRVMVRALWFYDFVDHPVRMWQGKGKLFTADGTVWWGSIDANNNDIHKVPSMQDGRDGSSANYTFSMTIPDIPGTSTGDLYEQLKADQGSVQGRTITKYYAIFKEGEALRPSTPIAFSKQLIMQSPSFSEALVRGDDGSLVRTYRVSITAKDANFGRSNTPNRTYSDAGQKERARQLGVTTVDRGCEFLGTLANRTYTVQ